MNYAALGFVVLFLWIVFGLILFAILSCKFQNAGDIFLFIISMIAIPFIIGLLVIIAKIGYAVLQFLGQFGKFVWNIL